MARTHRRLSLTVFVLFCACLIGGCRDNGMDEMLEIGAISRSTPIRAVNLSLDSIKARDTLRVLTRNNAATYFLHKGKEVGFEYELVKRFADQLGVKLKVIVPPRWDDLIPWLLEGKGDMIAAGMSITPQRGALVQFTHPYNKVHQVIVNRIDADSIASPADLKGKRVHVRRHSSYFESLTRLNREVGGIRITPVPGYYETDYLIELVMDGVIDITVADINIAQMEQSQFDSLRINCRISDDDSIAWAVRPDGKELLREANTFIDKNYTRGRSMIYNILYKRYFRHAVRYDRYRTSLESLRDEGRISPFDDIIRERASEFRFGFPLIAAQVYQESRFDPKAKSWVGAVGLMQLMPRTARSLGVEDPWDPSDNVRGGVKYLRHLYDRFDDRLHSFDRLAFALASYNVGYSHLRDARTLARMEKRNPDKWAGSVEIMLLRLSRRDYYSRVPAGYARGREGVGYVNSIVDRGHTYDRLLRHQRLSADRPVISARLSHEPVCTGR